MERMNEIESRMAEIKALIETDGADLDALEAEVRSLKAEKEAIQERVEKRKELLDQVGKSGKVVKTFESEDKKMEERKFAPESMEYRNAYLKNLQGKPLDAEERTAVTATAVIPTLTLNKIYEKLEQTSVLYPYISKSFLPGYVTIPVENSKNDAAWVAMGTAATDGADSFSSISLSAYKLIKTVEITADNMAASVDAFEMFIVDALAKKLAKAVDAAICTGDGSSKASGLLKSGTITNTGTFTKTAMTFADLMTQIGDIGAEYRKNAKFVMPSAVFFSDVVPALAAKGIGVDTQLALQGRILGYEVILDDNMTADNIVFGDLSYYHWNWAQDVTISSDASVGFRTGSVVYRGMALCDGKVVNADAFNCYTRSAT